MTVDELDQNSLNLKLKKHGAAVVFIMMITLIRGLQKWYIVRMISVEVEWN